MNEKNKNILLGVLLVGIISMTVAYAALSTTLTINGTASVAATTWNIHFANWTKATTSNSLGYASNTGVQTTAATLTASTNSTKISGLVVTLNQPGDNVKYTFDIVNDGTVPAKLSSFTKHINSSTSNTSDGVTYTVTCNPANTANTQVLAANGGKATCSLTVNYDQLTNPNTNVAGSNQVLNNAAKSLDIDAEWVYVQQ